MRHTATAAGRLALACAAHGLAVKSRRDDISLRSAAPRCDDAALRSPDPGRRHPAVMAGPPKALTRSPCPPAGRGSRRLGLQHMPSGRRGGRHRQFKATAQFTSSCQGEIQVIRLWPTLVGRVSTTVADCPNSFDVSSWKLAPFSEERNSLPRIRSKLLKRIPSLKYFADQCGSQFSISVGSDSRDLRDGTRTRIRRRRGDTGSVVHGGSVSGLPIHARHRHLVPERIFQPSDDRRFYRGGRRSHELAHLLKLRHDRPGVHAELLGEFVDSDLGHRALPACERQTRLL
jgi:hypothetical protein